MDTNVNRIKELLAEARAEGITDPVILLLYEECPQARAICQELYGRPMEPRDIGGSGPGEVGIASRPDAIRLLRQFASKAGKFLGEVLQRPVRTQFSLVSLENGDSVVCTETDDRSLTGFTLGYEELMLRLHRSE